MIVTTHKGGMRSLGVVIDSPRSSSFIPVIGTVKKENGYGLVYKISKEFSLENY